MSIKKLFQIIVVCLSLCAVEFMKFQHISSALFCICIALTMAMSYSQLCNRRLSTFCLVCFSVLHALCFSLTPFILYCFPILCVCI